MESATQSHGRPQHFVLGLVLGFVFLGGMIAFCLSLGMVHGFFGVPPKVHQYNSAPAYSAAARPEQAGGEHR